MKISCLRCETNHSLCSSAEIQHFTCLATAIIIPPSGRDMFASRLPLCITIGCRESERGGLVIHHRSIYKPLDTAFPLGLNVSRPQDPLLEINPPCIELDERKDGGRNVPTAGRTVLPVSPSDSLQWVQG